MIFTNQYNLPFARDNKGFQQDPCRMLLASISIVPLVLSSSYESNPKIYQLMTLSSKPKKQYYKHQSSRVITDEKRKMPFNFEATNQPDKNQCQKDKRGTQNHNKYWKKGIQYEQKYPKVKLNYNPKTGDLQQRNKRQKKMYVEKKQQTDFIPSQTVQAKAQDKPSKPIIRHKKWPNRVYIEVQRQKSQQFVRVCQQSSQAQSEESQKAKLQIPVSYLQKAQTFARAEKAELDETSLAQWNFVKMHMDFISLYPREWRCCLCGYPINLFNNFCVNCYVEGSYYRIINQHPFVTADSPFYCLRQKQLFDAEDCEFRETEEFERTTKDIDRFLDLLMD